MPASKKGKGIKDLLKRGASAAFQAARAAKLVSKGLNAAGYKNAGKVAEALGMGKKRRKRGKGPILGAIGGALGSWMPGWGHGRGPAGRGFVTNENAKVLIV